MLAAVRVRLILLTLIVAVPLIAANLFVINRLASEQAEAQKQALIATTRALAAAVHAELKKYAVMGRSLSTSVQLEERNFERFHRQALEASAPLPGAWVVVADVEGQQLVNTLRVFGEKLPMVAPLEVHRRALQTGIEHLAKQTATSVSDFSASFVSRIVSLARTHDLLTESNWDTVQLKGIFENELTAYQNSDCTRISLSGNRIALNSKEAVAISMIVHELATNAAKHSALSKIDGRLRISWKQLDETVAINWEGENGHLLTVRSVVALELS